MNTQSRTHLRPLMSRARHAAAAALLMLAAACSDAPTGTAVAGRPNVGMEGKYHMGYVLGRDGQPRKILFEVVRGDAVVEGDLVIGRAADVPRTPEEARRAGTAGPRLSLATNTTAAYWPGGVVPYRFKANASDSTRGYTLQAIALINRRIDGVTFVEATDTTAPHLLVQDDNNTGGSCRGEVGRDANGPTTINVKGCKQGVVAHEILHTLGFKHEQMRHDRDTYIDITSTLAANGNWAVDSTDVTYSGTTYDLLSIMHYDSTAGFNGSRVDLWLAEDGVDASRRIGQRDSLSSCDNYALDQIYPSTGTPVCSRGYTAFATYHTLASYWASERGLIMDEEESGFTMSSAWGYSSGSANPDYDNRHYYTTDSSKKGWYTFQVPGAAVYNFYTWAFQKSGVTAGTAVYKLYAGTPSQITSTSVPVVTWEWTQSQGLRWLYQADASLAAGTYTLQIQKKSGTTGIFADAIRITQDDNDPLN